MVSDMAGENWHDLGMNEGASTSSKPIEAASAAHVIAGFRYQLLHSVAALIALGEKETLYLEVSEDFSVTGSGESTDRQVKNSQAAAGPPPYSLQSKLVRDCLARFWNASQTGSVNRRLVFMARGGAAVERDFGFPGGKPGLQYWQAAAGDADTASIREALAILFAGEPLGAWIGSSPSDDDLRGKLLRRVSWQLELASAEELGHLIQEQLRPVFFSRGWPVSLASQAMKLLVEKAFETASRPHAADRQLNRLDLEEVVEGVGKDAWLAGQAFQRAATATPEQDILVSSLDAVVPGAHRTTTVDSLLAEVRGEPLLWIHGAHG